jgi:DNA polymerase III alpha subunit (gram-positive type)
MDEASNIGQAEAPSGHAMMAPDGQAEAPAIDGQATHQTSTIAPGAEAVEESFFDYNEIKGNPQLEAAYKQMQAAFTQKQQGLSGGADKIAAYDRFMQNPVSEIQALAQQYGLQIQGAQDQQQQQFDPKSWDDVMQHMRQQVIQDLQPMISEVQSVKKQNIETHFDNNFPDWRQYEDDMKRNLQAHPSLAGDPDMLYRMSVPQKVWESRATQAAMKKLSAQSSSAQVSGGGTTNRQPKSIEKARSFNEAFEMAKQQMTGR